MKKRTYSLFAVVSVTACLSALALFAAPEGDGYKNVTVLCYHDIRPDPKGRFSINPQVFEEQLNIIEESGFEVIDLHTLNRHLMTEQPFKKPPVLITIDDGYPSLKNWVAPVLRKYSMPAVFFIYTRQITAERADRKKPARYLGWEDLRSFEEQGFSIQSHSIDHMRLDTALTGAASSSDPDYLNRLYRELVYSYERLQNNMKPAGGRVYAFAFPYGVYTPRLARQALAAGYSLVFSTDYNHVRLGIDHNVLARFTVSRSTSHAELRKILHAAKNK